MKVVRHRIFKKHFKKRIYTNQKLTKKFQNRLSMFLCDFNDPLLKDHALSGDMKGFRSFWVGGDIRVIYRKKGKNIELYDIGTHNQVY